MPESPTKVVKQSSLQLGQFTLKAFSSDPSENSANVDFDKIEDEAALAEAGAAKQMMQQYLPLLIVRNKGACYSHSLYPEKMLVN